MIHFSFAALIVSEWIRLRPWAQQICGGQCQQKSPAWIICAFDRDAQSYRRLLVRVKLRARVGGRRRPCAQSAVYVGDELPRALNGARQASSMIIGTVSTFMNGDPLLFVYGTLRRRMNHDLHQVLADGASFLGNGTFRGKLYNLGRYPGSIEIRTR